MGYDPGEANSRYYTVGFGAADPITRDSNGKINGVSCNEAADADEAIF